MADSKKNAHQDTITIGGDEPLKELVPVNEIERQLVQLHLNEINSEEFLAALFNEKLFVLTTEDQVDKNREKLLENAKLFTLSGSRQQPYLAIFTDSLRAKLIQDRLEKFSVMIQVPVGDILASTARIGIVVNPLWDRHAHWEPEQIGVFGNLMQRSQEGLWSRIPEDQLIEVMTNEGYPIKMAREKFRQFILPEHIKNSKSNPDHLYGVITSAVNDGLSKDVVEAARHLFTIDPIKERAATALSLTLITAGELDEAESVITAYNAENERSALLIANEAKLAEARGEQEKCIPLLAEALSIDPNIASILEWYCVLVSQTEGGTKSVISALDALDGIAGSWRPSMLLGRAKLMLGNLEEAVSHYRDALEVDGHEPEALLIATGELGQSGNHEALVEFGLPLYNPQLDDPRAGLNILQGCIASNRIEDARKLAEVMEQLPNENVKNAVKQILEKIPA